MTIQEIAAHIVISTIGCLFAIGYAAEIRDCIKKKRYIPITFLTIIGILLGIKFLIKEIIIIGIMEIYKKIKDGKSEKRKKEQTAFRQAAANIPQPESYEEFRARKLAEQEAVKEEP